MDDLNNLNPNNNQSNPTQGPNPYSNMGFDPNQSSDPYASLNPMPFNPDMDANPHQNSNPYQGSDTFSGMNPNVSQPTGSDDVVNTPSNSNVQNPPFQEYDADSIENLANNNSLDQETNYSNINNFDKQSTINPILSQNIHNDNNSIPNVDNQNNTTDSNMNYGDNNINANMGYEQNNFVDPNMSYGDNSVNANMGYEQNNFVDPNMSYEDNNINANINNEFNQVQNNMNTESDNYNTDFVKTWMGNLYEKAHSKKFNWSAALFGGIYFLYRKMYLTGILLTLLNLLIYSLLIFLVTKIGAVSLALTGVASIVFLIIYGFSFYPLYRNFVHNKLKKYKQSITDNSQLLNIARTKGNTSVISVIVYCIVAPIVLAIVSSLLVTVGIINFGSNLFNDKSKNNNTNELSSTDNNPVTDIQLFNFTDNYMVEYDSIVWYLDEEHNTLTKGNYSLLFAQTIANVSNTFSADVSSPSGRSALLGTLLNSLETQAVARNLSVESGVSNFVMGTNAYYGYIDVIAADNISRYYLVLLPDDNLLFQFVLTTNDTTIDYETNLEAINILTSVYKNEDIDTDNEQELNQNTIENNIEDTNTINSNNINKTITNSTDVDDTNSISNDDNSTSENLTSDDSENVANVSSGLSDVLN